MRPGSSFLYTVPVSGERPILYSVERLPPGLVIDSETGFITGKLSAPAEYPIILKAENAKGVATRKFRIVCGDRIALTPPMGWNSWNALAETVSQEKVLRAAQTMVSSGLIQYGWSYINIDDTWQGQRSGPDLALQGNEKFPDMEKLDPFTLSLLSNSEVIALDQDALGRPAVRVATDGPIDVYVKELEDGAKAIGFFNRSAQPYTGTFTKLRRIGIKGKQTVRDLWRQQDLPDCENKIPIAVPADGVPLLRFTSAAQ